jgi:excisionase family DNA binding protein
MRGPSTTSNAGDESAAGVTTRVPELRPANGKCQEGRVRMCTARTRARETRILSRDEVMTAREVADLLKMPVSTIYQLARRGELPASRLGRTWRFLRPRLEELLAS